MANLYEGLQTVDATIGAPPPAPPTPPGLYDGLEMAPTVAAPAAREPQGLLEYAEAGIQGSGLGLAFRGKLPDLVMNPDTARWWERLATGVAGVAADLPIMIPAGAKGAALGAAVGGPLGAIVGGGSAMFAAPAGIRTSLMEVYKAQAGQTPYDWFNIVRETAKAMMHEGAVGAVTFGAGAVARGGAAAVMGATSQAATAVGLGTATMATRGAARAAGATDVAAQIAAMVTFPAALEGRLPESREFLDAAGVILTLKGAHMALERTGALKTVAQRIANVYERTGKTPIEQVMDAKADSRIAGDLTADRAWEWPKGVSDQPTKQEELWSIQGRLMELDRRAAGGVEEIRPLSDREALEREALRIKATALEAEGVVPDVPRETEPRFAEEQLIEAKAIADRRIAELATKEAAAPLTDIERAERIGLVNTMNNPEALAKRFGIEPAIKPITDADRDASADRVYADVLRQAREADAARQGAGLDPLGDEHAQQVAAIVRARLRTRAARLGVLPEDLYNERPLQIRDETQAEIIAAAEAIPPEAPRFVPPPEVDLFGEPVLPTNAPRVAGEAIPTVAVPLSSLKLSTDVPQFKAGANARGVVQPLQGEVDLRGVAPIAVWERMNGDLEVISGRHRLDLWARKGKETIDAQIFREADGFDIKQAAMLDAEMNIRDEHGSVSDYANYFKNSGISESEAKSRGLLGRAKGQSGFRIAMDASPDLLAAHRAGLLSDDAALVLSGTAPGSERLQALGMAMINDGKSTLFAANMMRTVDLMAAERLAAGAQGDIFGFDDSAMREAAAMAKKASSAQRKISERVSAISGASRRPEIARQEGVDVRDPEAIQKRIAELKQEQYQWDNWPLYPELVAKLRELHQDPIDFELKPETPAELKARDAEAAAAAQRKLAQERAGVKGPVPTVDQADLFNTQGTLFQTAAQTNTPEFKRWFRDSKVIDSKGKPLVVYRVLQEEYRDVKHLQYWTPDLAAADQYAGNSSPGTNIVPAHLSIKNPFNLYTDKAAQKLSDMVGADWRPSEAYFELVDGHPEVREALERLGYDGIKMPDGEGGINHDTYVSFHPTQIKSAIGNRGTFDPKDPNILFQDKTKPWYYSELARQISALPTARVPAEGLTGAEWQKLIWEPETTKKVAIRDAKNKPTGETKEVVVQGKPNLPGVKQEEIEATGLLEFLEIQEGKVTKEQVQAFMEQGGVKVTEQMLGGPNTPSLADPAIAGDMAALKREGWNVEHAPDEPSYIAFRDKNGNIEDVADLQRYAAEDPTLSTVATAAQHIFEYWSNTSTGEAQTRFSDYQLPGSVLGSYRELVLTLPPANKGPAVSIEDATSGRAKLPESVYGEFESIHYPDAGNYLAHTRVNDRVLPDGRKVLFVEEIQSDRAQKGRTEGFQKVWTEPEVAKFTVEAAPDQAWNVYDGAGNLLASPPKHLNDTAAQALQVVQKAARAGTLKMGAIPTAPFVTKTDSWTALVLKRLLRYAAEGEYDAIAWTRGEQQVERYTGALRKEVDVIEWKKTPEGVQLVGYKESGAFEPPHPRNTRLKVVDTTEKESALSDAIGKSFADRIKNDPNQTGTIEGDGITVSDTGMAGYYDRIVPKVAADVAKKVGGGKAVEIRISDNEPDLGEYRGVTENDIRWNDNGTHGDIYAPGAPHTVEHLITRSATEAQIQRILEANGPQAGAQQAIEITPAMREKIMAGLPLFQKPGQDRGDQHLGSYSIAENLITTFRNANKSTIVHELSHSWLEEMKADAARPDAPAQIKADWEIIRREFAIGEDGNISTASHEQFARTGERYLGEGVAPSIGLRAVFERFKAWMLEIYDNLANLGVEINPEVRGLFDRLLATDREIADAKALNVPVAYVPEARAAAAERIVPPAPEGRRIEPGFEAEQASMIPYADELPKGPGEAPDTSHINYAYINSPMDVKLAMQRMAEIDQANIQKQRGGTAGVKSWEQANAEQAKYVNDILGGSEDTLRLLSARDPNAAGPDVKLGILKKLAVGAAKDSARLRDVVLEAGHDATVRQQLEYMGSIERARMIQAEFLGERAGVARALNALKDVTEGTGEIGRMLDAIGYGEAAARELFQAARTPAEEQAFLRTKLDEILLNYKGRSVLDIAKLHKEIGTLKGTFKFTKEVAKATKWEMVVEGWKSSILSGPVTHTTNLFGTGAFQALRAPVDALAAVIGMARGASPGMGESDRASMSEAVARITGMLGGVQDGARAAVAEFRLDDPSGKTESYRTAIPGRAGDIIRIPLRLMGAEDAWIKTMYKRGEIRTLAIRQAFDEGLNPATREFSERRQYLTDNPTPEMQAIADAAAVRMTFNMPLGEKGAALQSFVNKWNLQWVVPFIRTPINIVKEAARMTPFAPLVGEWRAAIAKGGVERDRALAEVALGSAIMAVTVALAFDGMISGSSAGPDPGKNRGKVGVWQPGSVLIGDTWYEISRIEPLGTLMIAAADMAAVWDYMTDDEKDKVPKMVAVAFANSITNKTFLQGITNVINAMSEPGRFAPRFFQQLAGSMVPNVIGQPTTMADPYVREVNSMLDAIQARIPGMREQLLPRRDWLGAEMESKERVGVVMPVRKQPVSTDKVRLEAARLDISMAATPRKTHLGKGTGKIGDVEFTAEERNTFAKVGGEMAHDVLTNVVNDPGWDAMPDLVKRRVFAKVLQASHRVAAVAALPPEKRVAYITSISEQMAAELEPETQ